MKIKKTLLLTLFSFLSLFVFSNGFAQELLNDEQTIEPTFEKIYVSPDRILICPEGIFYFNEVGDLTPARLLCSDASGLYVVKAYYRCPGCDRWNTNNICNNPRCALYGR